MQSKSKEINGSSQSKSFMDKYVFRQFDPEHVKFFALEKELLEEAIGKSTAIEHVGSTAIPGLGGKGIIDIMIGSKKPESTKKELVTAGYEFRKNASTNTRLFFRKDYLHESGYRRVHIHLTKCRTRDWREIVAFRDYLLLHPDDVEKYSQIKQDAAELACGDGKIYREHKEEFIREIIKRAL